MKKLISAVFLIVLILGLTGCSSNNASNEVDYADDEAMQIIASGWEKRSDLIDGLTVADEDYVNKLKDGIQAEIDNDSSLKERQFENGDMQEDVIAYLNSLDDQLEVLDSYSMNDFDFYDKWNKVYDERSILLKKFVDEYGMTVNAKYQDELDDILANGTSATEENTQRNELDNLISNLEWKTTEEYGSYTYTAVAENTTDYNFENVSLNIGLYDADGVRTENYASCSAWKKGEKVKFEVYGDSSKAKRIEATVDYFDVAE